MSPTPIPYQRIAPADAARLLRAEARPVLFDVRDLASYQAGHIDGAMHLTEQRLVPWFGRQAKDQPVLIYCYKGNASQAYAQMFVDFRFSQVYSVDGGYAPLAAALAEA